MPVNRARLTLVFVFWALHNHLQVLVVFNFLLFLLLLIILLIIVLLLNLLLILLLAMYLIFVDVVALSFLKIMLLFR